MYAYQLEPFIDGAKGWFTITEKDLDKVYEPEDICTGYLKITNDVNDANMKQGLD